MENISSRSDRPTRGAPPPVKELVRSALCGLAGRIYGAGGHEPGRWLEFGWELLWEVVKHCHMGGSGKPCADGCGLYSYISLSSDLGKLLTQLCWSRAWICWITLTPLVTSASYTPLEYQTTTSLGLAQVQPRGPKAIVATGAAARALKNVIIFYQK